MNYNQRIKDLEEQIEEIKAVQHNHGIHGAAKVINRKLIKEATEAELQFKKIAKLKHLKLKFQYRINIYKGHRITKFYFADFCDPINKLIFEIDGGYHFTEDQIKKDLKRTRALVKEGFKIFRITNEEVFNGGTTSFLVNAYGSIGIQI